MRLPEGYRWVGRWVGALEGRATAEGTERGGGGGGGFAADGGLQSAAASSPCPSAPAGLTHGAQATPRRHARACIRARRGRLPSGCNKPRWPRPATQRRAHRARARGGWRRSSAVGADAGPWPAPHTRVRSPPPASRSTLPHPARPRCKAGGRGGGLVSARAAARCGSPPAGRPDGPRDGGCRRLDRQDWDQRRRVRTRRGASGSFDAVPPAAAARRGLARLGHGS